MNIKIKNKRIFLLAFFVAGFFLTFGVQKASAANDCGTTFQPGYVCIDVTVFPNVTGCVANHCTDNPNVNVKCCPPTNNANASANNANTSGAAASATTSSNCDPNDKTKFCNPLRFATVELFLTGIMSAIQRIVVVLALVFIMIGSVMILASAGSSDMVENGKKAITMALVGFAIAIAAPSLLNELANIIGWSGARPAALTFTEIAMRVLNFLLGTMGIIALVMMVIGAIMYLTSAGDEDRIDKGKEIFKYSLIGVAMAMSAMVLLTQIAKFFQ